MLWMCNRLTPFFNIYIAYAYVSNLGYSLSIGLCDLKTSFCICIWKHQSFSVYTTGRAVSKNTKLGPYFGGQILGVKFETLDTNLGQSSRKPSCR